MSRHEGLRPVSLYMRHEIWPPAVQKPRSKSILCAFSPPLTHAAISVTRQDFSAHEDGCCAVLGLTGNLRDTELNRRPQIARRSERSLLLFL